MVLYLYAGTPLSMLKSSSAKPRVYAGIYAVYVCVCSNRVEAEGMLVRGATGGRSCYKTCHFLSSSKLRPILPHFAGAHRL